MDGDAAARAAANWNQFSARARPAFDAWQHDIEQPGAVQERILADLLRANRDSAFGRAHGFGEIRDLEQYRARVPIVSYADVQPWIERAESEYGAILTAQAPLFFERSSGSSAQRKHIPYTAAFLAELQRGIVVWLCLLHDAVPGIAHGRQYWSMSPPTQASTRAANGIAIGSDSDLSYVAGSVVECLAPTLIVPPNLHDANAWRAQTLLALAAAEDLAFVSVWSPTFLSSLLRPLFDPQAEDRASTIALLRESLPIARWRAVQSAMEEGHCAPLWPRLAAVSCWMDGPSAYFAAQLRRWFAHAAFSPKGLLATEGVVSISNGTSVACPLAIQSHFLEFIGDDGAVFTADTLVIGRSYRVVISTGGGLYRYVLGDRVRVNGFLARTPCVGFVGRGGVCSDLVGEKLDEGLVGAALDAVFGAGCGASLVPCTQSDPPHYVALLPAAAPADAACSEELAAALDAGLSQAFHYGHARRLGQLGAVRVVRVAALAALWQRAAEQAGLRAGDAKPRALAGSPALARGLLEGSVSSERQA